MSTRFRSVLILCATGLLACSGTEAGTPETAIGAQDAAILESSTCDAMPGAMDCVDTCDGHLYGPSCIGGQWKCVVKPKEQCPDAAPDVPCGPIPGPIDCTDPCTGQFYSPTCVGGSWGCHQAVPDGGCGPGEAGSDAGSFPCGPFECMIGSQYCRHPTPPGICPGPDAGVCPAGCPGCPPLDPKCDAIPGECANSITCTCILKAICGSTMNGLCQPTSGGLSAVCNSM